MVNMIDNFKKTKVSLRFFSMHFVIIYCSNSVSKEGDKYN